MSYSDYAKEILSRNSYKLTTPRLLVLGLLEVSDVSQNAYEIAKKISKNKKVDVVSVYRNLSLFKKLGLVHEMSEGKFIVCQKFDCKNSTHCHHQFVCVSCNRTEEIHVNDRSFVRKLAKMFPRLLINSHNFRFEGLCEKCKQ
ncbi:MAG: transcriptional repressor [Candidatus Gracilibacteria bacterium]|jgi:Fe2+ or Zn2+ uptake regulation protein